MRVQRSDQIPKKFYEKNAEKCALKKERCLDPCFPSFFLMSLPPTISGLYTLCGLSVLSFSLSHYVHTSSSLPLLIVVSSSLQPFNFSCLHFVLPLLLFQGSERFSAPVPDINTYLRN